MIYILLYSSGLFVTSFSISFAIVAYFLHKFNNSNKNITSISKSIYKEFQNKYPVYKIDNLEDIENIESIEFYKYFFTEETPSGKVIMKYNKNNYVFEYYSDKHISNRLLEVVCRGYVLEFKCKYIYTNYYNEFSNRYKVLEKYDEKIKEKEKNKQIEEENNDIFATFKSYNMKKNEKSNTKSDILLKQQYNKFKYLGKLCDFNEKTGDNVNNNNNLNYENISYQKFKNM